MMTLLTITAHVAPLIFLLTLVCLIGNSRIANHQLNGQFTLGFCISLSVFSLFGIFASIKASLPNAYAVSYAAFTLGNAWVVFQIYFGISKVSKEEAEQQTLIAPVPVGRDWDPRSTQNKEHSASVEA